MRSVRPGRRWRSGSHLLGDIPLRRLPDVAFALTSPRHAAAAFAVLCAAANAQAETPGLRMMPDGSRDLYVGAGIASAPKTAGAADRETRGALLLQMQWSSGIFLSGLTLGMHLSDSPTVEAGPLLTIESGRSASGSQTLTGIGGIDGTAAGSTLIGGLQPARTVMVQRYTEIQARPEAGGFFHYNFDRSLRVMTTALYGGGNDRNGLVLTATLQKALPAMPAHHHVAVSAGASWANGPYLRSWFGTAPVTQPDGRMTVGYAPSAGLRDVQAALNWNWELGSMWLLSSQVAVTRLMDDAARSPLTDRRNTVAVRTGLAYRF
ncbi:MipA/OmpV family protein [Oxalobacteraceae bacterium OM1]|nr:MipA/OmpV family protein [Oxalobacteraceae bacterium OM1]